MTELGRPSVREDSPRGGGEVLPARLEQVAAHLGTKCSASPTSFNTEIPRARVVQLPFGDTTITDVSLCSATL